MIFLNVSWKCQAIFNPPDWPRHWVTLYESCVWRTGLLCKKLNSWVWVYHVPDASLEFRNLEILLLILNTSYSNPNNLCCILLYSLCIDPTAEVELQRLWVCPMTSCIALELYRVIYWTSKGPHFHVPRARTGDKDQNNKPRRKGTEFTDSSVHIPRRKAHCLYVDSSLDDAVTPFPSYTCWIGAPEDCVSKTC